MVPTNTEVINRVLNWGAKGKPSQVSPDCPVMNSNTLDALPSAVYGTSSSRSFLSQNLVYTVAPLRPEFFQMWYIQENWAQKSCLYHCSIKTGVFPDVVFSRLLNLKDFRTYSSAICRAASASPATVCKGHVRIMFAVHIRICESISL